MALEKGWLTVALALMVPGVAWIADKRPLPALRILVGVLVAGVLARIAWNPAIVGLTDLGTTPIFNWLLWGYGIPAAAFWLGGSHLAPARRRCAGAHGGFGRAPVRGAARVPRSPPLHDRRQHLPRFERRSTRSPCT